MNHPIVGVLPRGASCAVIMGLCVGAPGRALAQAPKLVPGVPDIAAVCGPPIQQPCRVVHPIGGLLYTDPKTGHPMVAFNSSAPPRGAALLVDYSDPSHLVTKALPFSVGIGGWDLVALPDNHMLFESIGDPVALIDVDLAARSITATTTAKTTPPNGYAWNLAVGNDGDVYYGSYPTCHSYKYDPATHAITDLGSMDVDYDGKPNTPANTYVRYIGVTGSRDGSGDGWVLSSIGGSLHGATDGVVMWKAGVPGYPKMVPGTLGVEPALRTVDGPDGQKIVYAVFPHDPPLRQFDPTQMKFVDAAANLPPCPTKTWAFVLHGSTAQSMIVGSKGVDYLIKGNEVTQILHTALLKGAGSLVGVDAAGNVVGQRGQSLYVSRPNPKSIADILHPLFPDVDNQPPSLAPMFLRADPGGGVTGAPCFGESVFRYDPHHPAAWVNTDQALSGDGEIYDGRWYNGKFYYVSYSGGDYTVWDPAKPWDQLDDLNPHGLLKSGYTRPLGGMVQNPTTHRFYTGWSGAYYSLTGGVTEYDSDTNTIRRWEAAQFDANNKPVSIGTVATDNQFVYGVTSNDFNGTHTPQEQPQTFWMLDPSGAGTVLARIPLGATSGCTCFCVPGTNHVWVAVRGGLRLFDPVAKTLGMLLPWPAQCSPTATGGKFDTLGNDAWVAAGQTIVRLHDGATPRMAALFHAPEGVSGIAANAVDRTLYVASDVNLYATGIK